MKTVNGYGAVVAQQVHGTPLFTQFLVRSEAAVSRGVSTMFPYWVAPSDPAAYEVRSFFQVAWLPAIGLIAFRMFFGKIDNAVMGYGLFRQTSDIEKLPFPMAPVGAQGLMALADDLEGGSSAEGQWRWRMFSIGGAIGMIFGGLYMGIPTITGALFKTPLKMFPIPFVDLTTNTQDFLPAVALGFSFNLSHIILGMVFPFFAVVGSFAGAILMVIVNPILFKCDILQSWERDTSTVETLFKNNIDLYFSLGIGLSLAVAVIGIATALVSMRAAKKEQRERGNIPEGRGDIPNVVILISYLTSTALYIVVSGYLIDWHFGVMMVLLFYAYFYTPLISYVTARMEGLAGQIVEIPFIRELSFILSGYQGIAIWFLPVPKANYGVRTVFYRQAELTGTSFWSIWKTDLFLFPIILISMIGFSSFIWGLGEIPSETYPYTQEIWEFEAKNACLIFSSTLGEYTEFQDALSGVKVLIGFGVGMAVFGGLSVLNAPVMLFYGLVKGLGGTMIHFIAPQFLGAMLGRYYFERKIGKMWRKYITVVSAGFFCGSGLISMFFIGIRFLMGATNALPY